MANAEQPNRDGYPLGRGYGNDYMRGGEVFGGYGHEQRIEFSTPRGDLTSRTQTAGHDPSRRQ